MNITNRGKKWEILNSLWILWTFSLFLSCFAFFWIGGRAGQRKWAIIGLVYLFFNLALPFIAVGFREEIHPTLFDASMVLIYITWFASIVHAFMLRKEYLIRYEAVLDLKEATRDCFRNEIRKDYLGDTNSNNNATPLKPSTPTADTSNVTAQIDTAVIQQDTQKIDLNNCSKQELANLPGVGIALAKKAIELRGQNGFKSVQDFNTKLDLMPHFAIQIEQLSFVSPPQKKALPGENVGRVIDL
jgi:uncharacterized membrane protein YqaE (UPF0057 family)